MSKRAKVSDLVDYIMVVYETCCCKCNKEERIEFVGDDEDAAEILFKAGWRIIDEEILCPNCTKAHKAKLKA